MHEAKCLSLHPLISPCIRRVALQAAQAVVQACHASVPENPAVVGTACEG